MNKAIFLTALTMLSACQKALPPAPQPNDTCGAARFTYLRGAPESQVLALGFNQPVRIIAPGDKVTTDLVENRLNFALDANGNVADITCG